MNNQDKTVWQPGVYLAKKGSTSKKEIVFFDLPIDPTENIGSESFEKALGEATCFDKEKILEGIKEKLPVEIVKKLEWGEKEFGVDDLFPCVALCRISVTGEKFLRKICDETGIIHIPGYGVPD